MVIVVDVGLLQGRPQRALAVVGRRLFGACQSGLSVRGRVADMACS